MVPERRKRSQGSPTAQSGERQRPAASEFDKEEGKGGGGRRRREEEVYVACAEEEEEEQRQERRRRRRRRPGKEEQEQGARKKRRRRWPAPLALSFEVEGWRRAWEEGRRPLERSSNSSNNISSVEVFS